MSRTEVDTQTVVAAIRAETRARLATIRLEREAYRAAQREKWRAARLPDADSGLPPTEMPDDDHADPAMACDPDDGASAATVESPIADLDADAALGDEPFVATPEEAAAQPDPVASEPHGDAAPEHAGNEPSPAAKPQPSTKLRIAAAVTAATSTVSIAPPADPAPVAARTQEAPAEDLLPAESEPGSGTANLDDAVDIAPPAPVAEPETRTPLSALIWLGPGLIRRLSTAGIDHVEALAACDADSLAVALGPVGRLVNVATLISEAQASRAE